MNCPLKSTETTEILIDLCARTLPAGTALEVQRHIAGCEDCRAFTEAQQQVWSELDSWEAPPIGANFDRRLYDRIAESERPTSWRQWIARNLGWRPVLGAGMATAALGLTLFLGQPGARQALPERPVGVENSRIESIEPEQVERALEDLEMLQQLSASASQDL